MVRVVAFVLAPTAPGGRRVLVRIDGCRPLLTGRPPDHEGGGEASSHTWVVGGQLVWPIPRSQVPGHETRAMWRAWPYTCLSSHTMFEQSRAIS